MDRKKDSGDRGGDGGEVEPRAPLVLDGETLRRVNEAQGYRYRQRQKYLQEDDRVEIIRRLLAGEKQSDLAREFGVTRAAVCNTFKNRDDILARSRHVYDAQCARAAKADASTRTASSRAFVLKRESVRATATLDAETARSTSNEASTPADDGRPPQPVKKRRLGAARSSEHDRDQRDDPYRNATDDERHGAARRHSGVLSAHARSDGHLLASLALRESEQADKAHRSRSALRCGAGRIRECLSPVVHSIAARLRNPSTPPRQFRLLADQLIPLVLEELLGVSPPCSRRSHPPSCRGRIVAVGVGTGGFPLLRCFQARYPEHPVGLIQFASDTSDLRVIEVMLPGTAHNACAIVLMTSECNTGSAVCRAMEELLHRGVDESSILLLAIFLNSHALARLTGLFPAVHGLVASIVEPNNDSEAPYRPDNLVGFLDRYYDAEAAEE